MNRVRNFVADGLVAIVVFLVALWVLRRIIGLVLWLANLIALVAVVLVLLGVARALRGGSRRPRL